MNLRLTHCLLFIILLLVPAAFPASGDEPVWWNQAAEEAKENGYTLINLNDLKKLYASKEPFLIIDARPEYEYREGHLPGAVNFEFDPGDDLQFKPEKKEAFLKLLSPNKNRKIIIYCRSFR